MVGSRAIDSREHWFTNQLIFDLNLILLNLPTSVLSTFFLFFCGFLGQNFSLFGLLLNETDGSESTIFVLLFQFNLVLLLS